MTDQRNFYVFSRDGVLERQSSSPVTCKGATEHEGFTLVDSPRCSNETAPTTKLCRNFTPFPRRAVQRRALVAIRLSMRNRVARGNAELAMTYFRKRSDALTDHLLRRMCEADAYTPLAGRRVGRPLDAGIDGHARRERELLQTSRVDRIG